MSTLSSFEGRHRSLAPLLAVAVPCVLAIAGTAAYVLPELAVPVGFFGDFKVTIWEPGRELLAGRDPMRAVEDDYNGGVYPPLTIALTLPVSMLPFEQAAAVWLVILLGGVAGALYICGVRDWRCYGLALTSPPVIAGVAYGNVSLLVVLAIAGVWVLRYQPWRSGMLLGLVLATRLFPWPIVAWFVLTRRMRAALVAAGSSMVFSLAGWTVVSFHRIGEFPAVTRSNASEFVDQGVSIASIAANLGLGSRGIGVISVLASAVMLAVAARNRHDDLACFSLTIGAALFASPIVWGHYFAMLLVPIAVASPQLSQTWLLPFVTAPQLTGTFEAGGKILDSLSGVLFACLTVGRVRGQGSTLK